MAGISVLACNIIGTEQYMNSSAEITRAIRGAKHIVITGHIRPDGDAVGACLGLARSLNNAGFTTTVLDLEPLPERCRFLPRPGECRSSENFDFAATDLIIVLDSGSLDRSPEFVAARKDSIPVINIDHHISNTEFGRLNLVEPAASSVGEILCRLLPEAGFEITTPAAEALWVSIVTDTGRFSYSNTTAATMQAAARLLQTGIRSHDINHELYNSVPLRQIRLQGRAINNLTIHENGKLALTTISESDFTELGCTPADTEEIVNIARNIENVSAAVFLYELSDKNETKVSLRTAEPYDAAELCRSLGGGGHARAAGCTMPGRLAETKPAILRIIHKQWFVK